MCAISLSLRATPFLYLLPVKAEIISLSCYSLSADMLTRPPLGLTSDSPARLFSMIPT
jgi:hypothetical protein